MTCKYCETEHPQDQIANPHYCIARMEEEIAKKDTEIVVFKEEYKRLLHEKRDEFCQICGAHDRIKELEEQLRLADKTADTWFENYNNLGVVCADHKKRINKLEGAYNELIMAVERKWEGETRHQTALKYIRMAETSNGMIAKQALKEKK